MPDLRLGYVVAPLWARVALVAAKQATDGWCSGVAQTTLALMIKEGHVARHVRKMQRVYGRRRALLLEQLRTSFHHWLTPLSSSAGLHITVVLKEPYREESIAVRARHIGVEVGSLGSFYLGRRTRQGFIFGYGQIEEPVIRQGLQLFLQSMPRR